MPDQPKIDIACGTCNSRNVSRDAWANWDITSQDWVLGAVFDAGFCHRCESERSLIEVPVGQLANA